MGGGVTATPLEVDLDELKKLAGEYNNWQEFDAADLYNRTDLQKEIYRPQNQSVNAAARLTKSPREIEEQAQKLMEKCL